jgi:hypothetical protein
MRLILIAALLSGCTYIVQAKQEPSDVVGVAAPDLADPPADLAQPISPDLADPPAADLAHDAPDLARPDDLAHTAGDLELAGDCSQTGLPVNSVCQNNTQCCHGLCRANVGESGFCN